MRPSSKNRLIPHPLVPARNDISLRDMIYIVTAPLAFARKEECEGGTFAGSPTRVQSKPRLRGRFCAAKPQAPPTKKDTQERVFLFGGAEGSRTPVRKHFIRTFSERSQVSTFPPRADTGQTTRFSRVMMRGRGNSYPPHVRHINDAFPGLWPLRFRRLPLVRQRQQYDCCQFIFKLPVLWRSGAAARLSCLRTPVETGTAP